MSVSLRTIFVVPVLKKKNWDGRRRSFNFVSAKHLNCASLHLLTLFRHKFCENNITNKLLMPVDIRREVRRKSDIRLLNYLNFHSAQPISKLKSPNLRGKWHKQFSISLANFASLAKFRH